MNSSYMMFPKDEKLQAKLNRFYTSGRYSDVTIVCEEKSFHVHRLILALKCNYFDALFGSDFKEKTQTIIELHHVSPEAFEEVLHFLYTGQVILTSDNFLDILSATDYLEISDLQNLCVEFALKRIPSSYSCALDVFAFACRIKMNALIRKYSEYLTSNFEPLSKTEDFLKIPGSDLKILLRHVSSSPLSPREEDTLLTALIRWSCNSREDKRQFFYELIKLLPFDNVSVDFRSRFYGEFINKANATCLTRIIELADKDIYSELYRENKHSLHVFVEDYDKLLLRTFSIDNSGQCAISSEIPRPYVDRAVRVVTLDNSSLYCLNFQRHYPPLNFRPVFKLYTSIDMRIRKLLRSPPLQVWDVEMCGLRNNVYLYDQGNSPFYGSEADYSESPLFDREEIRRGVYAYNSDVDNWFPVSKMKKQVAHACVTACGDTLFVIGGVAHESGFLRSNNAQAYDVRVGKWRELPRCNFEYEFATCCALKNKIYVFGNGRAEKYDQVAGKWETIDSVRGDQEYLSRAISYANKIWVMPCVTLDINVYEPEVNEWSVCKISDATAEMPNLTCSIVEAVVSESLHDRSEYSI